MSRDMIRDSTIPAGFSPCWAILTRTRRQSIPVIGTEYRLEVIGDCFWIVP